MKRVRRGGIGRGAESLSPVGQRDGFGLRSPRSETSFMGGMMREGVKARFWGLSLKPACSMPSFANSSLSLDPPRRGVVP